MNLAFTSDELAFRQTVRDFVQRELPAAIRAKMQAGDELSKNDYVDWQHRLNARGWLAPNWPRQYGGTGWSVVQKHLFDEEIALGSAPRQLPFGVSMVAPVIIAFGNDEQRAYYLPRILSSEDWWCQGYSEAGSGSDLASLQMRAERVGDAYVINGTKTWITLAQYANMIFVLARTDATVKKQRGISFILVDMTTPGVSVRPIQTLDGGHEINEVHFENVRVPVSNRVGDEGAGWTYAKFLLEHERNGTGSVAGSFQSLEVLKTLAAKQQDGGRSVLENDAFAAKIATVEIELTALSYFQLRSLAAENAGASPGPESSIIKIRGTEIQQTITELAMDAGGYAALDVNAKLAARYFNLRKASIYAGSNEIQRNIIAKRMLGL